KREQRTAAFAVNRVAGNFGIGSGATVAGFIVAFAQRLSSFQTLYFFDAVTYAAFALIVLAAVPSPRAETVTATDANGTGFRGVKRAFCGQPARGAASDAHPLGARCDQSPCRRCDRLRNRRMRTHQRSRATGRGHGSSPSARPLPVSLQSDLHRLPGPRPGD